MGIWAAKQVTLPMCAAISVSCRETLKSPRRWRRITVFSKQANRSLRGVCRELFVPFPAAFCRCVFQGSGGVRLSQKQEKLPLFPCTGQLHSCCFGIVSSWLQDVSFGMSVFCSHGRWWEAPALQAVGAWVRMEEPERIPGWEESWCANPIPCTSWRCSPETHHAFI